MTLQPGTRLGFYEILEQIGAGGMGEVYRAKDTKLGREVAIKVLRGELASDPERLRRFEQEARAASALDHPNIITIYDISESDGIHYIVMQLVKGKTLRELLDKGPLPTERLLRFATQISEGLAKAHHEGIIHRDLKPENLMVTKDGYVKILDFGLAKLLQPSSPRRSLGEGGPETDSERVTATKEGTVLGTVGYMSPEQAQGRSADQRSDQFSFGAIVYEMATGKRAFERDSAIQTLSAIIEDKPEPLARLNPKTPAPLRWIVERCLAKDPGRRYISTADLAKELEGLRDHLSEVPSESAAARPLLINKRMLIASAGLIAVVFALIFGLNMGGLRDRVLGEPGADSIRSLAVLPLENLSGDPEQEYFVDGMTEALIAELGQIESLRVISRTSIMLYKEARKPLREIARELDVEAVVEGSVVRAGDRIRITAQLVQAVPEKHLWAESYERELGDVLRLQSEIAQSIAREIRVRLTPEVEKRLASARQVVPEAYEAYVRGRHFQNYRTREGLDKSIEYFRRATGIDPEYAAAWAGLADSYDTQIFFGFAHPREALPQWRDAVMMALEIDEDLAEAHMSLASLKADGDWDWVGAVMEFERAIELNPNYANAHHWYANVLSALGRPEEAIERRKTGQRLDPLSPIRSASVAADMYFAGDYERAFDQLQQAFELSPDYPLAHYVAGLCHEQLSRTDEAIQSFEKARKGFEESSLVLGALGHAYAVSDRQNEALTIIEEMNQLSKRVHVHAFDMAIVYAGLDEDQKVLEWLERAFEDRFGWVTFIKVDPRLKHQHSEPRFQKLLQGMNLLD